MVRSGTGTQTNPRGVVSDDGTNNFWGSGSAVGIEWYNPALQNPPTQIEDLNSVRAVKVINGSLYTSLQYGDGGGLYPQGIYNLTTFSGALAALPENQSGAYFLHLVVPASSQYQNVDGFDMNPQRNIVYMADDSAGVTKYVEVNGNWQLACAFGITNNTGTGNTGCFGLVVDWTGNYPVVFATTTEGAGGAANSNRVIRIDDNYNFTDGQMHNITPTTLATAWQAGTNNVVFRGLAWTPDGRSTITINPASQSVVTGTSVNFNVVVSAAYPNTYYWLVNGTLDPSQTTSTYSVPSALVNGTYQVIVSNSFGAVTSSVANLTVTSGSVAPSLVSPVPALNLTNAVDDTITIPVTFSGTTPISYQWWQVTGSGSTLLANSGDFANTGTATLTINASTTADSGSYYVVANNGVGAPVSNLVATVTIVTPNPIIFSQPGNAIAASNGVAIFTVGGYPLSATYQWYQGTTPMSDVYGHWSGSQTQVLTDSDAQSTDATTYYVVVSSGGNSVTSSVVTLSVASPAPFSALPYTAFGEVYQQNFNSLPDPGTGYVNNGTTTVPATIGGTNYAVSNPFDFAAPLIVSGDVNATNGPGGGLNLSTMVGWYSSDLGAEQIQAQPGNTTTGLIISFGCTNRYRARPGQDLHDEQSRLGHDLVTGHGRQWQCGRSYGRCICTAHPQPDRSNPDQFQSELRQRALAQYH